MNKTRHYIRTLLLMLLFIGGMANEAWAAYTVTYHILTLPITATQPGNTNPDYHDHSYRWEALKVTDTNATTVGLPDKYKSPLAKNFTYYAADAVTKSGPYNDVYYNSNNKYYLYQISGSPLADNTVTKNCDIYVTYIYKEGNDIIEDDGSKPYISIPYHIVIKDRILSFNIGRNNRLALIPKKHNGNYIVEGEQLCDPDFSKIDLSDKNTGITTWWTGNKTPKEGAASHFHFRFRLKAKDPYNITICTDYEGNGVYYEKFGSDPNDMKKYYKWSTVFTGSKPTDDNLLIASDDHREYTKAYNEAGDPTYNDNKPDHGVGPGYGYYRKNSVQVWNSFSLLNNDKNDGYLFIGTKCIGTDGTIQGGGTDNKFYYLKADNNTLTFNLMTSKDASEKYSVDKKLYKMVDFTFHVKTPFGNIISAPKTWTEAYYDMPIQPKHVPASLLRKYCSIVGFYKDAALTQEITTFGDAVDVEHPDNPKHIYVKYEVTGAPFKAISPSASYTTATWYELTDAGSDQTSGKKLKYDGSTFKNNGANAVYDKESEFAFVGDPYELRVLYRKGTEEDDPPGNRYVGAADLVSAGTNLSVSETAGDGYKWEIPYDETDGSFELRQFRSSETTSMYWQWDTRSDGNNVTINSTSTRVKVMELPTFTYVYNIVDTNGTIAIKGTGRQTIFTPLNGYNTIPETIRSPFLSDETITFYDTFTEGNRSSLANERTIAPPTDMANIYVSYTTGQLEKKSINLDGAQTFNVKLNKNYIYYHDDTSILSNPSVDGDEKYLWRLTGKDPYAIKIYNQKATQYVKVDGGTWGNNKALVFDTYINNASRFIAMSSNYDGEYEFLAATGGLDSDSDGNSDLYHIGPDNAIGSQVKIFSTDHYPHGSEQLRFVLEGKTKITYTLIDKNKDSLLTVESYNARLALPSEYVSPLVATYYYFPTKAKALTSLASDIHNPNPDGSISEIGNDTNEDGTKPGDNHVWITYKVGDFQFGTSHQYMLKFLQPHAEGYYLEDGSDKLTTEKIQAVYPYCNGDGNLNIYGQPMKDEQISGGSSTRPRWVWFMESENRDPYHVQIHSRSTISSNGTHSTYLQTYAVHFNQDTELPNKQHIITGANFPGLTLEKATEYMILGVTGRYKLLTTNPLAADLDGNGNTTGTGENERRYVTSFEQYWKTYNMVKQEVLGINVKNDPLYKDKYSEDEEDYIVPAEKRNELLAAQPDWHSYKTIASAIRWNGYDDDKKANARVVENLEHWFQTFDMGDGTFDIEDANIPPFLVLIDRHGWEIMRKPLPIDTDTEEQKSNKLAALRAFDSPMVKEYKFYNNATKASNCHKYIIRLRDGKERDTISVNNVRYTSTSLAKLPPISAKGVKTNDGFINDHFVTYTVKEEYEKSYTYSLVYDSVKNSNGTVSYTVKSETGTPSAFIVLQNGTYAKDNAGTLTGDANPSNISNTIIEDRDKAEGSKTFNQNTLWNLQPNLDIDDEMGIPWATSVGNSNEPYQKDESKVKYKNKTGFDPYNLQLVNKSTGRYFTSHMTDSELSGGGYTGDYSGGGSKTVTLSAKSDGFVAESESYDHSHLKITNQTFMAVQDEKGNMQLMPRFDQDSRIDAFATLEDPLQHATTAKVDDGAAMMGHQTTFVVPPVVYDYRIIDNDGYPAMRYRTGGEFYPSIPEHFKSPLAKNFKYYKGYEKSGDIYKAVESTKEITNSFAAADIRTDADIFVRYEYAEDEDKEGYKILQGRWMTIKLNNLDVQATGSITSDGTGVSLYTGTGTGSKPTTAEDLEIATRWHWKFLASPVVSTSEYYRAPDPYAVQIFNRDANNKSGYPDGMGVPIKVDGKDRFVLLSHPNGDYALAAGSDSYASYSFLSGDGMTTPEDGSPKAASVVKDAQFNTTNSDIDNAARLIFNNDIPFRFTYYVITNSSHLAATKDQEQSTVESNGYIPELPKEIQTMLLNLNDYLYYGTAGISGVDYSIDTETKLSTLYGLYDSKVYVRYPAYDSDKSPYQVPNVRNGGTPVEVGSGSNPVSLDINGKLPYNIIWQEDNMMQSTDGYNISNGGSHPLDGGTNYIWKFEGGDPYALQIRHKGDGGKYVNSENTLSDAVGKTYMLLNKEGYEYGVLAETGDQDNLLSFDGETLSANSAHAQFIIFALSTEKLIYHLLIKPTDETIVIDYRKGTEEAPSSTLGSMTIKGTTQRDLTKYAINDVETGAISIGDKLEIPNTFYRPNCAYLYYVEGIYDDETTNAPNTELNNKYKGLEVTKLMSDAGLIGKTVKINVAYGFDTGLKTNAGDGFVRSIDENLWYTFETTGSTPYLTHYTNAWGLQALEGRDTRYTNDYLWTPVGDPFGFVMYNRYMGRNSNAATYVITTAGVPQDGSSIVMAEPPYADFTTYESNSSEYGGAAEGYKHTAQDKDDMKAQARLFTTSGDHYFYINAGESYKKVNVEQVFDPYAKYTTTESDASTYDGEANKKEVANLSEMHAAARELTAAGDYYYHITGDNTFKKVTIDADKYYVDATTSRGNTYADYVYELLSDDNTGSFKVCPLSNETLFLDDTSADPSNASLKNVMLRGVSATEWKFGLTEELFEPYYIRAGYVGGLTEEGKALYEAAAGDLMTLQSIVYDDANLVPYSPGYYRLHNQPGVSGLSTLRYASGYIHDIERTAVEGGIPMHFYSRKGITTTFAGADASLNSGFTESVATRGVLPVPATENDPSTIFYLNGNAAAINPTSNMQTQGLYVVANDNGDRDEGNKTNKLQRAAMAAPKDNGDLPDKAIMFTMMDIGGAVFLIHDGATPATRKYLNFDQTNNFQRTAKDVTDMENQAKKFISLGNYYFKIGSDQYYIVTMSTVYNASLGVDATYTKVKDTATDKEEKWKKAADNYDLKYYHECPTDDAKWCLEPANNQGLVLQTHKGGDSYYYTTFYAPFDVLLPDDKDDNIYQAFVCKVWDTEILHMKKVGKYNTGTYAGNDKFVPANTPVIIRTTDNSEKIKLTLPTSSPTTPKLDCIFMGQYLEQLLQGEVTSVERRVYTFGLPLSSPTIFIDTNSGATNGQIHNKVNGTWGKKNVGFYLNTNPDKELGGDETGQWIPNNRYVLGNKIYYRPSEVPSSSSAPKQTVSAEYIPVCFDDDDEEQDEELKPDGTREVIGDGCVYDLMGRKVATREQVEDGSWKQRVATGIYIINGKKIRR